MNPKFDLEDAGEFLGKRVIVDLTIRDYDERLVERRQLYGRIMRIDEDQGIVLTLIPSGDDYRLAPDLDQFVPLQPGEYRLEPEGEVAIDPAFRFSSVVHLPPPEYERKIPG